MSSTIPSLWPADLAPAVERTPLTILKEQASLLGAATKNLLEGRVETRSLGAGSDQVFEHWFDIIAPTLDMYKYQLLQVSHGLEPYPLKVTFYAVTPIMPKNLASEAEFVDYLRQVLASAETRRVIGALLAQVQS